MTDSNEIWVVDDDNSIRWVIDKALSGEDISCNSFECADDLLAALKTATPKAIISDIRMPDLDGRGLLREIRSRGIDVYTVMMSAYGGDEVAIQCMKEGAYDYFNKPFTADEVVLLLRKIEEREALQQAAGAKVPNEDFDQLEDPGLARLSLIHI